MQRAIKDFAKADLDLLAKARHSGGATAAVDSSVGRPPFSAVILRYFNVFGADPAGRLGESPRPELAGHGRISTACFDAAVGPADDWHYHSRHMEWSLSGRITRR